MSDFKFEKSHLENVIDELKENRVCLLKKLERVNQTKMDPELATALTNAYKSWILTIMEIRHTLQSLFIKTTKKARKKSYTSAKLAFSTAKMSKL